MIINCAKLFINLAMYDIVMGRRGTGFTQADAQSLNVDCNLDLWPSGMVLVRNTLSSHDDHWCQFEF